MPGLNLKTLANGSHACLAPMAGVCDRAFREVCSGFGAAITFGELTSAKGVSLGDGKSKALLSVSEDERPFASQIFGSDPETMAKAAAAAAEFNPDFIDINMGCPAPKVNASGGGASLMRDPLLAERIVGAVTGAVNLPVSVKIRTGWDESSLNAVEVAKRCEGAGAALVTVHGRTRAQMYAPPVNIGIIKDVKRAVKIPVIGNGDITDGKSAKLMYEETGCDLVMVGRGSLGNPFVFMEINAYINEGIILPRSEVCERVRVLLQHIKKTVEYKGEYIAMREARKHAAWYFKGLHGASELKRMAGALSQYEDLVELCLLVASR